jgi:hypothetical protein
LPETDTVTICKGQVPLRVRAICALGSKADDKRLEVASNIVFVVLQGMLQFAAVGFFSAAAMRAPSREALKASCPV